jgi:very-short-patch-repair endonuclease
LAAGDGTFAFVNEITHAIHQAAARNYGLIDRRTVLEYGGSDRVISGRLESGSWRQIHPGVYAIGVTPLTWQGRLRAATMAGGPHAVASHRSAMVLWGLDGLTTAPIEITVPVGKGPTPQGVTVHRTRRPILPTACDGIPVTTVERTLLDVAAVVTATLVEVAYDSAVRRSLTTPDKVARTLSEEGHWGVPGRAKVIAILDQRRPGRAAGSPPETILLRHLRKAGIEEPVRQYAVVLPDGSVAVIDLAWPQRLKGVEIDGLVAHASAKALESDLTRQNLLFEVHWQLRRFSARTIARNPNHVVDAIARFLAA